MPAILLAASSKVSGGNGNLEEILVVNQTAQPRVHNITTINNKYNAINISDIVCARIRILHLSYIKITDTHWFRQLDNNGSRFIQIMLSMPSASNVKIRKVKFQKAQYGNPTARLCPIIYDHYRTWEPGGGQGDGLGRLLGRGGVRRIARVRSCPSLAMPFPATL